MSHDPSPADEPRRAPVRRRIRPHAPAPTAVAAPPVSPVPTPARTLPRQTYAAADQTNAPHYEVGYRKPPQHSQFKPGPDPRRPRGRKAGSRNRANSIVEMMESPTVVRTPEGELKTISTAEAMARKLRELALKGELSAISKAFELHLKAQPPASPAPAGSDVPAAPAPSEIAATDQAILLWLEEEIRARHAQGNTP